MSTTTYAHHQSHAATLDRLDPETERVLAQLTRGLSIDTNCERDDYTAEDFADGAPVTYLVDLMAAVEVDRKSSFEAATVQLIAELAGNMGFVLVKKVGAK